MKNSFLYITWVIAFCAFVGSACGSQRAEGSSIKSFVDDLVEPAQISEFTINPESYSELSDDERIDALRARESLVALLRAIETTNSDALQYLSSDVTGVSDLRALRKSFIEDEAVLYQIIISDLVFSRNDEPSVKYYFDAIMITEGNLSVGKGEAWLVKRQGEWKVLRIASVEP